MKLGFIGAGKVGNTLGKYLSQNNQIIGYYDNFPQSAQEAATFTHSQVFTEPLELIDQCDSVFLTVPDGLIEPVWLDLIEQGLAAEKTGETPLKKRWSQKNFCHCSGAMPSSVFDRAQEFGAYGYSLHPLFAVSSKTETYKELHKAFFATEGSPEHLDQIVNLVKSLGNDVQVIETAEKVRYHAAAALASNFVVGLYKIACDELVKCGFSNEGAQKALAPLFLGNAEHVAADGYVKSLTGPAERGDMKTIEKHLGVLKGDTKVIYEKLNQVLLEIAKEKHSKE